MIFAMTLALAGDPAVLQPSGPWAAGVANGQCVVMREFAMGDLRALLDIGRAPVSSTSIRTVLPIKLDPDARAQKLELKMEPDGPQRSLMQNIAASGVARDGRRVRHLFGLEPADVDAITGAQVLRFSFGKAPPIRFAMTDGATALNALDACERKLAAEWGLDLTIMANVATRAVPHRPEFWIGYQDYPSAARTAKQQGTVITVYFAEPDGSVDECRVLVTSGHRSLDDVTCALLKQRAKIKPARDHEGKYIRQPMVQRITWLLP